MLEPGQIWFNGQSLERVTIGNGGAHHSPPYESNEWIHVVFDGAATLMDPNYFVANYVRDEPLSDAAFEACGFLFLGGYREWNLQIGDNAWLTYVPHDEDLFFWLSTPGNVDGYLNRRHYLPKPETLRDLRVLLRSFGANRSVIPQSEVNAT